MKYLIFVTLACFQTCIQAEVRKDASVYAVNPTVFILMRDEGIPGDWSKIINAALPEEERSEYLDKIKYWENIIIVDEGNFWAVSFHMKANGMLSNKEGARGLMEWTGNTYGGEGKVVYLEKETLRCVHAPEQGIKSAPPAYFPFFVPSESIDLGKVLDEFEARRKQIEEQQGRNDGTESEN